MNIVSFLFAIFIVATCRADDSIEELNYQISNALREDRYKDVIELSQTLLESVTDDSSIWYNLGVAHQRLNQISEAQSAFDKAIELDPTDTEIYSEAGQMLQQAGKNLEAIPYWQTVTQLEPENGSTTKPAIFNILNLPKAHAYYSLANVLHYSDHHNESIDAHKMAIKLNPHFFEAYNNIGTAFMSMREYSSAITYLHAALELQPQHPIPIMNVLFTQRKVADWRWYQQHLQWFSKTFDIETAKGNKLLDPWMASTFKLSGIQLRHLSELLARQINDIVHGYRYPRMNPLPIQPGERLRVGYVSSTGFQGKYTTAKFMRSIFGMHDHERIQVHCFARAETDHTPEREQIMEECEIFWEAGQWPLSRVADTVNSQQLHILIDLSGWTIFPGTEIFAMQPAPVQLQLHGFPGTMGADYYQYAATDVITSPPEYQEHYREKLMYSPATYLCNDFKQSRREVFLEWGSRWTNASNGALLQWPTRAEFGFEEDDIIFAAFNSLYKLDDVTLDIWLSVLQRLPKAKLWLLYFDDVSPVNLRKLAESYGVNASRLVFNDFFNRDREFVIKTLSDVFVDTPAFTAHTTGGDTLWVGLPLITVAAEDWSSRVASALCYASLVPETIARNLKDYRNLMYKLGKNKQRRLELRKKLLSKRENAPHFDTKKWVQDFEKQLYAAWDLAVVDHAPMQIVIPKYF